MTNCIFHKIINKEVPAHIIYEDENILAFLDHDPITDGHTLIIPKKHVIDIHDLDIETGGQILALAGRISGLLQSEFNFDGTTIMQNNGAFQDVPHFHLHVFGRSFKQNIKIDYPKNISSDTKDLQVNAKRLKNLLI